LQVQIMLVNLQKSLHQQFWQVNCHLSEHWQQDTLQELTRNLEEDKMDDPLDELCPQITLETDDLIMEISVKKDYSQIKDLDERKKEFINDLNDFIQEFSETPESKDFMAFFD